ncbi:MAG: hypothetical protein ABJF04_18710 [Reichenbachiella sp.]|uniref:hypothetical protein n=1 Tax=Reichenbachiella sp. TaxID=2184521 RepID=UPI0032638774
MKRVIVIFSLVFVSMFGFSACEDQADEIQIDIEDTKRPNEADDDEDETNGPG